MFGTFAVSVALILGTLGFVALPFELDAGLVAAFLQAYVVLIAFALGAPQLLLHSIDPPGLQSLIARTIRFTRSALAVLVYLTLGAVSTAGYGFFQRVSAGAPLSPAFVTALTGGICITLFSFLYYHHNFKLPRLRQRLFAVARQNNTDNSSPRNTRRRRLAVDHLVELGRMAPDVEDRRAVLDAFQNLALERMKSPTYFGDSLERLVRSVGKVAIAEFQVEGRTVITHAVRILANIRVRVGERREERESHRDENGLESWSNIDETRLTETIGSIARYAVREALAGRFSERDVAEVLTALGGGSTLFAICIEVAQASTSCQHQLAPMFGIRLLSEHLQGPNQRSEAYLLAFAAILRSTGPSVRRWAEETLAGPLKLDLPRALAEAEKLLYFEARFAAADAVRHWREELGPAPSSKTSRRASRSLLSLHLSPIQVIASPR